MKNISKKTKVFGWLFIFFFVTGLMSCGVQLGIEVLPATQSKTWKVEDEIVNPARFWRCLSVIQSKTDERGIIDELGKPKEIIDGEIRTLKYTYKPYYSGYKVWLITIPIPIVNRQNSTGCDVHISSGSPISATVYYHPSTYFYGCIKKNDPTVPTRADGCYWGAKHFDMYLTEKQRSELKMYKR